MYKAAGWAGTGTECVRGAACQDTGGRKTENGCGEAIQINTEIRVIARWNLTFRDFMLSPCHPLRLTHSVLINAPLIDTLARPLNSQKIQYVDDEHLDEMNFANFAMQILMNVKDSSLRSQWLSTTMDGWRRTGTSLPAFCGR